MFVSVQYKYPKPSFTIIFKWNIPLSDKNDVKTVKIVVKSYV